MLGLSAWGVKTTVFNTGRNLMRKGDGGWEQMNM